MNSATYKIYILQRVIVPIPYRFSHSTISPISPEYPSTRYAKRVSYLDNLENSLKALEAREQLDPEQLKRERQAKEEAQKEALKIAPYAEALRNSTFTNELLATSRTIGHSQRILVRFTWVGNILRLEAKEKKMELKPTAEGIFASFFENGEENSNFPLDLAGSAEELVRKWLNV